jgi:Na+/H+-dicarboxylate symporter
MGQRQARTEDRETEASVSSPACVSCKVIGTTTCLGLSTYFAVQSKTQPSPVGRTVMLGVAGGLAALGVARALVD